MRDAVQFFSITQYAPIDAVREPASLTAGNSGIKSRDGAEIWTRMQAAYDLWHAERALADQLERIELASRLSQLERRAVLRVNRRPLGRMPGALPDDPQGFRRAADLSGLRDVRVTALRPCHGRPHG